MLFHTDSVQAVGKVPVDLRGRGYIPKVFAFENQYPLNPKESDLFYFLLIRTKRPKSPKFQKAVSSSSELHAIQRIPRDNTTLALLLIIRQKADTRDMRKSVLIVPCVLDFALTLYSSINICFVAPSLRVSVTLLLRRSVALSLCCSVAPLLRRSVAPSLCRFIAPSLCPSVAPSLCLSVALLLHP